MPSRLALILILCVTSASAQTVDELVAKHVEARGGMANVLAIQTMRIERTVAATFNDIDVVIYKKRPHLYRSEARPEGSPAAIVRAPRHGSTVVTRRRSRSRRTAASRRPSRSGTGARSAA